MPKLPQIASSGRDASRGCPGRLKSWKISPGTPMDVLATMYPLLGYDLDTTLTDRTNRPVPLMPVGQVVRDVLA